MANKPTLIYWDTSVFIAYLQSEKERADMVEAWLEQVRRSDRQFRIVTSTLTIAEVAFVANEHKQKRLLPDGEERIERLWAERDIVAFIEPHEGIMRTARTLVRTTFQRGWKGIKPPDAIQLASAQHIDAQEVHTYDDWQQYELLIGRPIHEPVNAQMLLPGTEKL